MINVRPIKTTELNKHSLFKHRKLENNLNIQKELYWLSNPDWINWPSQYKYLELENKSIFKMNCIDPVISKDWCLFSRIFSKAVQG